MLNQFIIVGRIIEINEDNVMLRVFRSQKDEEGVYPEDYIKIFLPSNIASQIIDECSIEDCIGSKGHIETDENSNLKLIAEKVSWLSNAKNNSSEEDC